MIERFWGIRIREIIRGLHTNLIFRAYFSRPCRLLGKEFTYARLYIILNWIIWIIEFNKTNMSRGTKSYHWKLILRPLWAAPLPSSPLLLSLRHWHFYSIPFNLNYNFYYILSHYFLLHSLSFSIIHGPYIIRRELKYCCKYNIIVSHLYMHLYSVIDSMNSDVIPNSHMLLIQVSVLLLIRLPFTHSLSRNWVTATETWTTRMEIWRAICP